MQASSSPSGTPSATAPRTAPRWIPWAAAAAFALVFLYALAADLQQYVGDDAGITLRYSERIASGRGFNYNDGEAVNGCSNPLFGLTLAGFLALGLDAGEALRWVAALSYGGAAALLLATFARYYSVGAAAFSVLALVSFQRLVSGMFGGLETPLVVLLACLLFRALHTGGVVWAGIALGLLVANKLDGALAAVAFALAALLQRRGFPFRTAAVALVAALPTWVYLLASFGSILPNSMTTKLLWQSQSWELDRLWMHEHLALTDFRYLYYGAWLSLALPLVSTGARRSLPLATLQVWFLLHMGAYATINLGGPIPWYASVPLILSVILSSFLVHVASCAVLRRSQGRWPSLAWERAPPRWRASLTGLAAVAALAATKGGEVLERVSPPEVPHGLPPSAAFELSRQAVGAWLRKHTSGSELLASHCGLTAFEYGGPFYDLARLNSRPDDERRDAALYFVPPPRPAGAPLEWESGPYRLVATFPYDAYGERFALLARPESEVVRRGLYHVVAPWTRLWSTVGRRARRVPVDQRGGTWVLPAGGEARFELLLPAAPELVFRPRCARLRGGTGPVAIVAGPPEPARTLRLTLTVNGEQLLARDLVLNAEPATVRVGPGRANETGEYLVALSTTDSDPDEGERPSLLIEEAFVRVGEPLGADDFKLTYERIRRRVEYVRDTGLPYRELRR